MTRVDDARRWLQSVLGFTEAERRIALEARLLRVDPTSDAAVKHAIATYQLEAGKGPTSPTPAHLQEGLLP